MGYEAPKITEAGRLADVTLGDNIFAINYDNGHYWPGGDKTPTQGSR